MTAELHALNLRSVEYVTMNMRAADKREIFAQSRFDSEYVVAWHLWTSLKDRGLGRVVWWDGRPAIVAGVVEDWPGVWGCVMYGTDDTRCCVIEAIRYMRKVITEVMEEHEGHRLYADSRFDHTEAHRLLERLGARREAEMLGFGRDGSTYYRYAWVRGTGDEGALSPHGQEVARRKFDVREVKVSASPTTGRGTTDSDRLQLEHEQN